MQHLLFWIFGAFAGYLCGSLSSAVIVCRAMGYGDPRTLGSGNPGATNVLRIAGEKAAALTLAGDSLKGFLPLVFFAILRRFFPAGVDDLTIILVGLGAFFGHLYPIFFELKGGKGVATAFGVLLGWNPVVALLSVGIWGAVFWNTKISSLSALTAGGGAAALTACADLPTNGEVTSSDAVSSRSGQLVQTAARPRDGAGPEEIVSGFLRACIAGFSDDFATARVFLHRVASDAWDPAAVVRAYAGSMAPVVERDESGAVRVAVELVGSIDTAGILTSGASAEAGGTSAYTASYSLATDGLGQWRIVDLPSGVLLPAGSLSTNFVATNLYFLTPDRTRFVPDLRWLPRQDLAASAVAALLDGPTDWLAGGGAGGGGGGGGGGGARERTMTVCFCCECFWI